MKNDPVVIGGGSLEGHDDTCVGVQFSGTV